MIRRYRHNVSYALALSTVHSCSVCNSSQSLVTTQQSTCKSQLYLAIGNLIAWMLWHRSYHCNFCKPYVLQWLIGYINLLAVIFSKNQRIRCPQSWFLGLRTSYLCALVLSTEHYYLSCFCNISSNRPWMLVETKHLQRLTGMLFIVENKTGCLHGIGWVVSLQLLPLRSPFMHRNCSSCWYELLTLCNPFILCMIRANPHISLFTFFLSLSRLVCLRIQVNKDNKEFKVLLRSIFIC